MIPENRIVLTDTTFRNQFCGFRILLGDGRLKGACQVQSEYLMAASLVMMMFTVA